MSRKDRPANRKQPLRRKPPSQRAERWGRDPGAAIHEAGHAVAAAVLGIPLGRIRLEIGTGSDGIGFDGFAEMPGVSEASLVGIGADRALPYLVMSMAGRQAQGCFDRSALDASGPASEDILTEMRIANRAVCEGEWQGDHYVISDDEFQRRRPEVDAIGMRAAERTVQLVAEHMTAIEGVARTLLQRGWIDSEEVTSIVHASKENQSDRPG